MRWWLIVGLALASCKDSGGSEFLVAIRPVGEAWRVIDATCGEPIDTPRDRAYELAMIEYTDEDAHVRVRQAGPDDDVNRRYGVRGAEWSVCPYRRNYERVEVGVVGADIVNVSAKTGSTSAPGSLPLEELGVQDVIASEEAFVGTTPRFIIRRDVDVKSDGFTLDFTTAAPLEPLTVVIDGSYRSYTVPIVSTANGTVHYLPRDWSIPRTSLLESDLQIARINSDSPQTRGGTVYLDLRDRTGTLSVSMPPVVDNASSTVDGAMVSLSVTTALGWNELAATIADDENLEPRGPNASWYLERRRGWPDTELTFPDLASIPGWRDAWNLSRNYEGYVEPCEHIANDWRCTGGYWSSP